MEGYDTLHDLLVKLFNEIMNIEEKAIITEEFRDISNNDKGVKAYHHHANFHDEMIKATLNGLNEEQTKVLVKALTNLSAFFRTYGK